MKPTTIILLAISLIFVGCGVGDAPTPMSSADVKVALDNSTPQDQVKFIQSSPLNQAEKKKKIDEIKAKYKLSNEDIAKMTPGPGVRTGTGN